MNYTTTTDFECLSIELHNANQSNLVCPVIYRHPNSKLENLINYYTKIMGKISNEKILHNNGDFNINLLNYESHPLTHEFLGNLGPYCFQPYITQPTRITDHSATLIDNIEHETLRGNLICDISDHFSNFLILNKFACTSSNPTIYRRDYSNFNEEMLLEEVRQVNWEDVLPETEDVNLTFESFHNKLSDIINRHAPQHKLSKKEIRILAKPWITNGIRVSIAKKNKLYELYIKSKNDYYFSKFKTYRNKLKHLILVIKKSYYNKYFANNKYNIKNTWKGIKQLITLKHQPYLVPNLLEVENLKLTNSKSIANAFNKYFSNIGPNIANTIPIIDISFEKFLNKSLCHSFFLSPVSTLEVEEEMSNLNPSKSVAHF